ncbi:MAG: DUF960 family protein [Oscillospiraceae bacterium]
MFLPICISSCNSFSVSISFVLLRTHEFRTENPITAKIYVIDDGDHSTMLLAEEY